MQRHRRSAVLLVLLAFGVAPLVAACGDDDDSASTGPETVTVTTAGTTVSDAAPEELERWQADLNAVGCYAGAVDGSLGPETENAIREFQSAAGLQVDGLLGPETENALQDAVDAGETVCTGTTTAAATTTTTTATTTATTTSAGGSASLDSPDYVNTFTLDSCSLNADVGNISLRGAADGLTLTVDATQGTGTLGVAGGDEQDGITLNGDVEEVSIAADRSFDLSGTFGSPNFAGEPFSMSGSCPE
jgi:peptidoglycan hydrolase-like protein with peptidoglycan-binding domain